jgi:polyisoprenoid-binding protein YceI
MRQLTSFVILAGFAATAFAAPVTYVIDGGHTLPRFEYNHFGYSTQLSRFDKTTGKITLDRQARTGAVDVEIDAKSIDSGNLLLNKHLQDADFFDVAKYPTITFKSDDLKFEGDKLVSVTGDLSIKGITRPVTLQVTSFKCMPHPMMKREACGADATAVIKRSEFNLSKYVPYVSDEVTLTIPVEAVVE